MSYQQHYCPNCSCPHCKEGRTRIVAEFTAAPQPRLSARKLQRLEQESFLLPKIDWANRLWPFTLGGILMISCIGLGGINYDLSTKLYTLSFMCGGSILSITWLILIGDTWRAWMINALNNKPHLSTPLPEKTEPQEENIETIPVNTPYNTYYVPKKRTSVNLDGFEITGEWLDEIERQFRSDFVTLRRHVFKGWTGEEYQKLTAKLVEVGYLEKRGRANVFVDNIKELFYDKE